MTRRRDRRQRTPGQLETASAPPRINYHRPRALRSRTAARGGRTFQTHAARAPGRLANRACRNRCRRSKDRLNKRAARRPPASPVPCGRHRRRLPRKSAHPTQPPTARALCDRFDRSNNATARGPTRSPRASHGFRIARCAIRQSPGGSGWCRTGRYSAYRVERRPSFRRPPSNRRTHRFLPPCFDRLLRSRDSPIRHRS